MKVLVTGSRNFVNTAFLEQAILESGATLVVHGAARGADLLAEAICKKHEINYRGYPAKWKRDGKAAGPRRNREMLNIEHVLSREPIDLCLAFPGNGSGTQDMMALCEAEGIPVRTQPPWSADAVRMKAEND